MAYTIREGSAHEHDAVGVPVLGIGQDGVYKAMPLHEPDAFSTDEVNVPAANTAAVLTFTAAGENMANVLSGLAYSYSAAPTGGRLTIADGSETVLDLDITAAGENTIEFKPPRKGRANRAMTVTLAAGGAGITGKLNTLGHWITFQVLVGQLDFSEENQSGLLLLFF